MPLTPKNRKEEWLQGLVDHETTLTPKNRKETWMKEIIDASGGGGGDDIDLGITGASVGEYAKIKTVDADGVPTAWESGTGGGGGGALVCHVDENDALDKTWQEIKNSYDAGTVVMLLGTTAPYIVQYLHSLNYGHGVYNVEFGEFDTLTRDSYSTDSADGYPVYSE